MNNAVAIRIGRILLSILFVFSAISKYISLPFFDGMVAEFLIGPDYFDHPTSMFWTQVLTRVLITAELVLGIAVLQNKWYRNVILPAIGVTLIFFTIHLFMDSFSKPNGFIEGNCGCFGDVLPMTNLESIIKNVIAIILTLALWNKNRPEVHFSTLTIPLTVGLVSMFTLSFGIKSSGSEPSVVPEITDTIPDIIIDTLAQPIDTASESIEISNPNPSNTLPEEPEVRTTPSANPPVNTKSKKTSNLLNQYVPAMKSFDHSTGKKLICLFSMTCSHCQEVYRDICAFNNNANLPPIYLINFGTEYEQKYFFSQAGNCKHDHSLIEDFTTFKRLLEGNTYPRLILYENGEIKKEWNVDTYSKEDFMKYFDLKEKEDNNGGLDLKSDNPFDW